jgi:hypothetical protein
MDNLFNEMIGGLQNAYPPTWLVFNRLDMQTGPQPPLLAGMKKKANARIMWPRH